MDAVWLILSINLAASVVLIIIVSLICVRMSKPKGGLVPRDTVLLHELVRLSENGDFRTIKSKLNHYKIAKM